MVVHAYFPLAEPRVQREARAARDAGFDVTVLCLRGPGESARETIDGIRVRRMPLRHERGAGVMRILYEYLTFCALATGWLGIRAGRRSFDVIQFHNPPDFLIFCGLLPRARGTKLILDVHDLSSHIFGVRVGGRLGTLGATLLLWIERLACALADAVITVHEQYRRELVRHGVPQAKIYVVMNSIDGAVLELARTATPFAEPSTGFQLAYHGTVTQWYGTDLIVDAVAELREAGMVDLSAMIIGDGDALPELRRQIAAQRLDRHVHLSERYLPIEQALAQVAVADCGVIPNRPTEINRFALSSKLFEYVALGIPVVVARLDTLAAHFDHDEVTFFDPGDSSSLSAAIRWVYENGDQARAKAERAQSRAEEYSWLRGRQTLLQLYHELLAEDVA